MLPLQEALTRASKSARYAIVVIMFALYVGVFTYFHDNYGLQLTAFAIFPIVVGSWYFGVRGGILITLISILANMGSLLAFDHSLGALFTGAGYIVGNFILIFISIIVGRMATMLHERGETLRKLNELKDERQNHIELLETLSKITKVVLEANDLKSALEILLEQSTQLFKADDGFLALWDEANNKPVPIMAHGAMKDVYPEMDIGDSGLTRHIMEVGRPLGIEDLKNSPYANPGLVSQFSIYSVLGLPLIVQGHKLAILYLGYKQHHSFEKNEITNAERVAQKIALVLTKIKLLEETQKQVKQLTALHKVAIITTEAETIDQLIERTTEVIGKNLFSDNFGILLMDDKKGVLHPHPSYRFISSNHPIPSEVLLGRGVSGQVAQTGIPIILGNIKDMDNYINVDSSIASELCVPIKIKDRILGVINAESTKLNAYTQEDFILLGTLAGQLATAIEQLKSEEAERNWLERLAHSNELIYALAHITTYIEKKYQIDDVVQTLGDELSKINITSMISLFDREKKVFSVNYTSISQKTLKKLEEAISFPLGNYTFSREDLYSRIGAENLTQPMSVSNPENEFQILIPYRFSKQIGVSLQEADVTLPLEIFRLPLIFEETLLGILWLWGEAITKMDLPIMSIFANQIGINIQNAYLFQEIQNLALTDPLTGLHNRRSLFELGRIEFSRAHRMNRSFCCMMLDLDHFKKVNDTYGHQVGDQILQKFAEHCKKSVRDVDLVGRYGGEELIILLPETDLGTAKMVAERLRKSLAEKSIDLPNQALNITVSIGISRKDQNTLQLETLISRADQAMYIAKHKGRNRVAVSI